MSKEKIKGFYLGIIVTVLCSVFVITVSASVASKLLNAEFRDIKISVDGMTITPKDVNGKALEPFIVDGSTYLPVRAVADSVGYNVEWNGNTSTVILTKKSDSSKQNNFSVYKSELDKLSKDKDYIENLYSSLLGNLTPDSDDAAIIVSLKNDLIPKMKDYISKAEKISITDKELENIHNIYLSMWNVRLILINSLVLAVENQDESETVVNTLEIANSEFTRLKETYDNMLAEYQKK